MADSTIISASLDDKELKASIKSMVSDFNTHLEDMKNKADKAVEYINNSIKNIGKNGFNIGSASVDDGVAKKAKKQQEEWTKSVKDTEMSYDKLLGAMQMAQRQVKMYSSKTWLTSADLSKWENSIMRVAELREKLDEKTRELSIGNILKHQGVTDMREYVTSLMKPNESLKRLNDDYKEWEKTSKKTTQSTIEDFTKYSDEIQKQAKKIRDSVEFKKEGRYQWTEKSGDTMVVSANEKKYGSVEEQLARMQQIRINNARELFAVETKTTDKATDLERIRERQAQLQEQYLASRKTEEEIQENIKRNTKEAAEALNAARDNQGRISNLSDNFRYESTIDDLKRLEDAYNNLNDATKRSQLGKDVKKYIDELKTSLTSLGDKMQDDQLEAANLGNAYVTLSRKLTRLNTIYEHLNETERNSERGKGIADSIQRTARAMQEIQSQKMRPKSLKDVLGLDEKTLDDIVYKMQMLQVYRSGLDANTQKGEIEQVNEALKRLGRTQRDILGENESLMKSNNALARSFNYMKNRLAFYFTVGASTAFVKKLIEIRSQYELTERALGILVDSASRGSRIFNELSNMSLMSPYTLIELSNAAKQLTAFDIAAKDVVDTTRRLADMAAAVGAPIERLTYALGQIKAYGYLNSRDARMFANAGIPLVKELSNYYSELEGRMVTVADVYDKMKKKAIDYSDVMNVVNKLTDEGGKFYDFQAKMADTLKVKLANLNLAYNNMLNDMGKSDGGILQFSIKGVTLMMKHWREISRVLGTVVTTLGVYKTIQHLTLIQGAQGVRNFASMFVNIAAKIRIATTSLAGFRAVVSSIPFIGWATAITAVLSYFALFNRSADETAQKMKEISDAMNGIRKEASDLYVDAIKTDNFGVQINKLKDLLELAETELHITIPVNIEDVNESNILEKLRFVTNEVEKYINFSQRFSEEAVGSDYNERFENYGNAARTLYSSITESVNTVIQSLTELQEKGKASAEEVSALYELLQGKLQGESDVEYLQRIVELYERLGLLSERNINKKTDSGWYVDTWKEDIVRQGEVVERYNIKNWEVFFNMLKDAQGYFQNSKAAAKEFEEQIDRIGKKIEINNIPESERTLKLQIAIEQEAARNNWNEFAVQYAKHIANEKFGTQIVISDKSKKNAEAELQEWQKQIQQWAKENGISFTISFQADDTPKEFADRMGKEWKDAVANYEALSRKGTYGLATDTEIQTAKHIAEERKKLAAAAGYDTSDKKNQRKTAESELQKALKEEIQLLDKARSVYKQLTKEGVASNEALTIATEGYEETITHINSVLQKYGIQKFNLSAYAGVQNPHAIMELLQNQLDALVKSGVVKPEEIKELKMKLKDVNVDSVSFDQETLTNSINNELDKLKDEYELAVQLDANPELGDMFSSLFGIVPEQLPHTFVEYADKVKDLLNKLFEGRGESTRLETMFFSEDDLNAYKQVLGKASFEDLRKAYESLKKMREDAVNDVQKMLDDYISKYGDLDAQIRKIEADKNAAIKKLDSVFYTDRMKESKAYFDALNAIEEEYKRKAANAVFENLKKTDDFDRFFNAIDTLTMTEAKDIKARIQKAITESFKNGGMTITQFRRELSNLQQQFDKLGKSSTLFTSFLKGGFEGLIKRAKELGNELTVIGENINKSGVVDEKDKSFLSSLGKIFDVGGGKLGDFTQLLNKYGSNVQGLGNAVSQAGQGMQGAASSFAGAVGIVDTIIKNIHGAIVGINEIMDVLNQGRNEESKVGGKVWDAITAFDKYAASGWEKLKSGNVLGAIADTALSIIAPIVSIFQAQNRAITRKIEESERKVRKLENAYKDLEFTAENAYGAIASGANRATIENKKLQLAEAKRQLELEQSRRAKYRDQDKIIEYQGKIKDLENEITKAANDITNEILGISSAGEGITQLVDTMIEAFKNGENAMDAFGESWDKMIDNMIAKLLVSTFMQREWDNLMNIINEKEEEFTGQAAKNKAEASKFLSDIEGLSDEELKNYVKRVLANKWWNGEYKWDYISVGDDVMKKLINSMVESYKRQFESASDELDSASIDWTQWAIDYMSTTGRDTLLKQAEMLNEALGDWFTFGENNAAQLSNLQQGISAITEETAGAVEAYLNGISQQVYLHSELLTQIRDAIVGANFDVQLDVQSQMLLQLQNGYQTMNAMRTMMENWQTPSGNGIRVEML